MDKLQEMKIFVAVVETGSFVGASTHLSTSKAAISRLMGTLETRLGVRLMHRTTRRLSLTEEGHTFYARAKAILADLDEAEAEVSARADQARGLLRINVPVTFGIRHLAPLWGNFMQQNPGVTLDITLSDRLVDLVEEGYDVAVRITQLTNTSLISRTLTTTPLILCASPVYLATRPALTHPTELTEHAVLAYSLSPTGDLWEFNGPDGPVAVRVVPRLKTNNGDTCRAAALRHCGLMLQPRFLVEDDLRSGTLVQVLPGYPARELGIYAVYPTRKHVASKVRVLIDFLIQAFKTT